MINLSAVYKKQFSPVTLFIVFNLILISILFGCSTDVHNGYTISGNFIDGGGKKVFLDEINSTSIEAVDSTIIRENGDFFFYGNSSEPKFYLVRLTGENFITIVIDSMDQLQISGNANYLSRSYEVEGSRDSKLIRQLVLRHGKEKTTLDSLGKIYRENINQSNLDSIKTVLDSSFQVLVNNYRDYLRTFIRENPSSFACLMALYQSLDNRSVIIDPQADLSLFELVQDSLMRAYPNSKHVKALKANILEKKRQVEVTNAQHSGLSIGDIAPDFALPTPEGDTISLSSLRGKVVLLDFWASWCAPCRRENPTLVANYANYKSKNFEILQVSLDKNKSDWEKAIFADKLSSWKHVSDLQFWNCAPAKVYGVASIPSNFLIDKEGMILAKDLRGQDLGKKLAEVL